MRLILFLVKIAAAVVALTLCALSVAQIFVNATAHMPIEQIAVIQWVFLGAAAFFTGVTTGIPLNWDDVIYSN